MGLRDVIRAIREYPAAHTELETAQFKLQQAQQALEHSEQECRSLHLALGERTQDIKFLSQKSAALQAALREFCPSISSLDDMKRLYSTITPNLDRKGFTLYHMAEHLTGLDVPSFFPYEENCGLFEEMDGHQLLRYLTAAHFQAVEWTIVPGTTYESATLREIDTSPTEYQKFEQELYRKVLERMGFQDILVPVQEQDVATIGRTTELKLYSRLSGELTEQEYDDPHPLDGSDLVEFQTEILRGIEDEQLPDDEGRGLMTYFDGSDSVNEKVVSLFPTVELVNGELYGVAVCRIIGTLTPDELRELKEYCQSQYNDGWGEGFAQRPRRTEHGDLHVSFWEDNSFSILTKQELESAQRQSRPMSLAEKNRGGYEGR